MGDSRLELAESQEKNLYKIYVEMVKEFVI